MTEVDVRAGLARADRELLGRVADELDVEPGAVLMHEGGFGGEAFLVLRGAVEVRKGGEVVAELGPGEVVGELAVVSESRRRNATVVVTEPTRVLVLHPRAYRSLRDRPALRRLLERPDRYSGAA